MADLYTQAASVVKQANMKKGTLKTLVYSLNFRNPKKLFALVSECIKYQSILKDILSRCSGSSSLLSDELIDNNEEMAIVLLYDLLIGKGFGNACHVRKVMRKYNAVIKAAKTVYLEENDAKSLIQVFQNKSGETKALPRYARVNMIKCSVTEAVDKLREDGWEYVGKLSIDRFQEDASKLGEAQVGLDPLLDDVLVFAIGTDLHDYFMVNDGILVLQDRASCVPARALNPPPGTVVLDSCAAPGNKTSHLASILKDQGHIIALDRDAQRMEIMKSLLKRSGAGCIETIVQDFLTLSPQSDEVANITMILVDPSCSGSGMSKADREDMNTDRLERLKRFQISLLKHALRFPNAQRVVYSTCSIYQQENEEVVEEVMNNLKKHFRFVPVFPEWPDSRGLETFANHNCFLRLSPEKHSTLGFFVACFERKSSPSDEDVGEENDGKHKDIENGHDNHTSALQSLEITENADSGSSRKKKGKERNSEELDHDDSKSKRVKRKKVGADDVDDRLTVDDAEDICKRKKKKKRKLDHEQEINEDMSQNDSSVELSCHKTKKKKKTDKTADDKVDEGLTVDDAEDICKQKKKKKKKFDHEENMNEDMSQNDSSVELSCPKKKKKKNKDEYDGDKDIDEQREEDGGSLVEYNGQTPLKKKKSKKEKRENKNVTGNCEQSIESECNISKKKKKKKKKSKDDEDI